MYKLRILMIDQVLVTGGVGFIRSLWPYNSSLLNYEVTVPDDLPLFSINSHLLGENKVSRNSILSNYQLY